MATETWLRVLEKDDLTDIKNRKERIGEIMINWKVRVKNKQFWMSLIPAIALVVQAVAAVFGWELDFGTLTGKVLSVIDAVFALLVILGIVVDPTTAGIGDSKRAMGYEEPWVDGTSGTDLLCSTCVEQKVPSPRS